jgi:hypothetical protein
MKEADTFVHLLSHGFYRATIFRYKGLIVAIGAATFALAAVAIGAGKACIDGYFLNSFVKF